VAHELPCEWQGLIGSERATEGLGTCASEVGLVSVNPPTDYWDFRRSTMRNKSFATLGLLALLAATSAFGQDRLQFDVPFEFHFGKVVMPAGRYVVSPNYHETQGLAFVQCSACGARAFAMTFNAGENTESIKAHLVFRKYEDTYFLSSIWSRSGIGSGFSVSKAEQEISRRAALDGTSTVLFARP
jgi:hypothetical protein